MIKKIIAIAASLAPNFLKIPMYKLVGYKIGKNVKIKPLTLLLANKVNIGDNVNIGALNIFKMNKLEVGKNSTIRSLNMIIGPKSLKLGERVQIVGPFTFMNLAEDIELGDRSGLGSHSIFYTHGVYLPYTEGHPRKFGKIKLGKNVWSPAHVTILPGVNIGDDSIISAGSLINSSFPKNSLISGNPAKRISKASYVKAKMTEEKLQERISEIIEDFMRSKNIKDMKIQIQKGISKIQIQKYDEVILFGENISNTKEKNTSIFDIEKRKMKIGGKLGKDFFNHLETYGEYFDE